MRALFKMACLIPLTSAGLLFGGWFHAHAEERQTLAYAPAPVDNPLKGLVPYASARRDPFPHSMEFQYLALDRLVKSYTEYDWQPLETLLNEVAGRGHQLIFRVYLEYPGKKEGIPDFLLQDGLKVHRYLNTNTQPFPPSDVITPDYENPRLRKLLRDFIAALGKKYDGDPRVGFITAGLLGTWGEWHDYPREELFASTVVQREVMDAYAAAFKTTPILLRYPRGEGDSKQASNFDRPFGYHDDSFAWATLDTGKEQDDWYFVPALRAAGTKAMDKWKLYPIGGEIRPEAWGKVFDKKPGDKRIQNFDECVRVTHVSWLMDTGMFERAQTPQRRQRAEEAVRRLGYEYHLQAATIAKITDHHLPVEVECINRGVAPFYYDWPMEYGIISDGELQKIVRGTGKARGLLPGEPARIWRDRLDLTGLPAGRHELALRVPNPLTTGKPLGFANPPYTAKAKEKRQHAGWVLLGAFTIP